MNNEHLLNQLGIIRDVDEFFKTCEKEDGPLFQVIGQLESSIRFMKSDHDNERLGCAVWRLIDASIMLREYIEKNFDKEMADCILSATGMSASGLPSRNK